MSRIIKVTSRQGTQPTIQQPLVDFDIPSGQYDLSKSYFVLNSTLPSANQNSINLLKLQTRDANGNADNEMRDSVVFVRHAKLRSSTNGQIENNRHINALRLNQKTYEQSISNIKSQAIMSGLETYNSVNNLAGSHYRNVNKIGSTLSSDRSHNYIIRMKDVLPFCGKADYYDSDDKGNLSVGLELNLGRPDGTSAFVCTQKLSDTDTYWDRTYDGQPANNRMANVGGAGNVTELTTQRAFPNLDASPYHVGQRLIIRATNLNNKTVGNFTVGATYIIRSVGGSDFTSAGAPNNDLGTEFTATSSGTAGGTGVASTVEFRQITQIDKNTNNTLKLTLESALVFSGAASDIAVKGVAETGLATKVPTFNFMELVLVQVPKQEPRDYEYSTYKLQEDTVATASLNKTYMISPMCKNVYVLTPDDNVQLLSNRQIDNYRFSVDNVLQSNRAIQFGVRADSLHELQVLKTYDNKDEPLKSLTGKLLGTGNSKTNDGGSTFGKSYMVMQPTPITDRPKLLGLELNSTGNMGRVMIYEEEIKRL